MTVTTLAVMRRVVNHLFDPQPVAVLYAHSTQEVATALQCATINNIPVTVAGGRHSYIGSSVLSGYFAGRGMINIVLVSSMPIPLPYSGHVQPDAIRCGSRQQHHPGWRRHEKRALCAQPEENWHPRRCSHRGQLPIGRHLW